MSTYRELIELAAKAAGTDIDPERYDDAWGFALRRTETWWNPLTDDGDALRLAVACKISFGLGSDTGRMRVAWFISVGLHALDMPEDHPMALPSSEVQWLRRAIVCAAAEIGRQM